MITDIRLAGGHDPRTIALLREAFPGYWDTPELQPELEVVIKAGRQQAEGV